MSRPNHEKVVKSCMRDSESVVWSGAHSNDALSPSGIWTPSRTVIFYVAFGF